MADDLKNVIIIEDDELITEMYKASLAQAKLNIEMYKDGESGLAAMMQKTPDLVILDFMMPKLNGVEVIKRMRADEKLKNVPAILMSSLSDAADKQRAMDAGATAYWQKNEVNMVEFETKINEILSRQ